MLEASAHQQLKALLQREGLQRWPHHLTLSRLVARSFRRVDHTLVRLVPGTDPSWWISLLVPLALSEAPLALVVSDPLRHRLLNVEWPRLRSVGLLLPCWEGLEAPASARVWLLSHKELVDAWQNRRLGNRQIVIPEAEALETQLRQALAVMVEPHHWDGLRRAQPAAEAALLNLHERLNRRVLSHPRHPHHLVPLAEDDETPMRHLLALLQPLPDPWPHWLGAAGNGWCSWARVNPTLLQWQLHRQPLEPLQALAGLLVNRGAVLIGTFPAGGNQDQVADSARVRRPAATAALGFCPKVTVELGDPPLADPLPLYAPQRQPLPNNPIYADHLLEQGRRLVLGQAGLTVFLLDDDGLRRHLASGLAAEFGSRVTHESTAPEGNGVLCCGWLWWQEHQERLPLPCQIVVGLLPIPSLEDPLTAARVTEWRQQGRDWFRELLLPEALIRLQGGLTGLRRQGGRLAVLDGRLRGRGWGSEVLRALEPWSPLTRLRPL